MTVCAKETFAFDAPNRAQVVVRRGQPFPDDHPYVKGHEHLFEPADAVATRSAAAASVSGAAPTAAAVETATASPGERRSVARKSSGSSGSSSRFAEEV